MNTSILVQPKIHGDKVTIEIPKKVLEGILRYKEKEQPVAKHDIRQYRGILKDKIDIDPLEYQKKIRAEWDRDLDI